MSKFIFKPSYIDFGTEPCTKNIRFIHECVAITVVDYPVWISSVSVDFVAYDTGSPLVGVLTATVGSDATPRNTSGYIELLCDADTVLVPLVYSYESEYVPINTIIDNVLFGAGDTSYIGERDRSRAILAAKRWVQDNSHATPAGVRFSELSVEEGFVYLPADFKDWVGMYICTEDGFLLPLYYNDNSNVANSPVLDSDNLFVLDSNGFVVASFGATARMNNTPYTYYGSNVRYITGSVKRGELSNNGMFVYDKDNRRFAVSGVEEEFVVLMYVSDPLIRDRLNMDFVKLSVHKSYQEALESFIYYKLVEINMAVPIYEKNRALREYSNASKRGDRRKMKISELIQLIRG